MLQQLTAEGDDLRSTVDTLKEELVLSNEEAERASRELESMRTRAFEENAHEAMVRERELRESQADLERCRLERDEWERALLQERVFADESRSSLESLMRDLELEREARERDAHELEMEREKANNLQSVLEDFQAGEYTKCFAVPNLSSCHVAKDHEIRQAVKDFESRFNDVTVSLAEYKHRAITAEVRSCTWSSMLYLSRTIAPTRRIIHKCVAFARVRKGGEREEPSHQ